MTTTPKVSLKDQVRQYGGGIMTPTDATKTVWRLRVSLGRDEVTGRYRQQERTFKGTEPQARRALAGMVANVAEAKVAPGRLTVGQLLDAYQRHCAAKGDAPKTLHSYDGMRTYLKTLWGDRQAAKVTGPAIDELLAFIGREKRQSSAAHYWRYLRAAFRFGVRKGLLTRAPTDHATAIVEPKPQVKAPSAAALRQLIALAEADDEGDDAAMLWLAATTGKRRGELCGLQVGDVDLDRGELAVVRSVSRVKGVDHVKRTKAELEQRIALDPETVAVLDRQLRRIAKRRALCGLKPSKDAFVFSGDADHVKPLNPDRVTGRWRRLAKRAGVEGFRFHDIRHYAATQMLANGVDVVTAAGRLGDDPAVMLQRYAHVIRARDQEAAAILGRSLLDD
jgi:integrase